MEAADTFSELLHMVDRRVKGYPLEPIVGWAQFYGHKMIVRPGVFVPRKRSELLVQRGLRALADRPVMNVTQRILDLCCGSGAVAAAIARELSLPAIDGAIDGAINVSLEGAQQEISDRSVDGASGWEMYAADVDQASVDCAAENLAPSSGQVYCGDLFDPLPHTLRGTFALIVANAPYVPTAAIAFMPQEARLHEPEAALNGGRDGLDLHRSIAAQAPLWLERGAFLMLESSVGQAAATASILAEHGFSTAICSNTELGGTVVTGRLG